MEPEMKVETEIEVIGATVDALLRIDEDAQYRVLCYLWRRFVTDPAIARLKEKGAPLSPYPPSPV